jgi:hypothetical protein
MNQPSQAPLGHVTTRELPREGAWRVFLLDIPREGILAERDRRLLAMALPPEDAGLPAQLAARRQRLAEAALGDASPPRPPRICAFGSTSPWRPK